MSDSAPASRPPVTLAVLAFELGISPTELASRVTRLVHERGHEAVIHTAHPSNRRTLLQGDAADILRAAAGPARPADQVRRAGA